MSADEVDQLREMLRRRCEDIESGRVQLINGEAFFEQLRLREEQMIKRRDVR